MCLRCVLTSLVGDWEDALVGGNDPILGSVGSEVGSLEGDWEGCEK